MSSKKLAEKVEKATEVIRLRLEHNMSIRQRRDVFEQVSSEFDVDPDYVKEVLGYTKQCKIKG